MSAGQGVSSAAKTVVPVWAVLVNAEEQHGLFPADQPAPQGWRPAGFTGTEDECVTFVDRSWADLRPLSLRRAMDGTTTDGTVTQGGPGR